MAEKLPQVLHEYGTSQEYQNLKNTSQLDSNTLYFLTDVGKIYKGEDQLSSTIHFVTDVPIADAARTETLYVVSKDDKIQLYIKQSETGSMVPITSGSDDESLENALVGVSSSKAKGSNDVVLTFTKADGTTTEVTIADLFLLGASYNTETKKLKLTVAGQDEPIEVELPDSAPIWHKTTDEDVEEDSDETSAQKVEFYRCILSEYPGLQGNAKENAIFFVTDTKEIFLGNRNMTSSVIIVDELPNILNASPNKLYINTTTLECAVRVESSGSWLKLIPGILSDGSNWADADSDMIATIGAVKEGIQEAIKDITGVDIDVSNKVDKVDGVKDNIVVFGDDNAIADSGYKIGGAELSNIANENTIATEKAVKNAINDIDASCTWKPMIK